MSALPVGKTRYRRPLSSYNKCVKIYQLDQFRFGIVSMYGCAPFVLKTANIKADILVRLRSNLCLWGPPPPYSGKGRPRKHGDKFKLTESSTWSEVTQSIEVNHSKLGRVKVSLWSNLHFRKTATRPMSLIRVERLDELGNLRVSKPLWLAWVGEEMPTLEKVW